MSEDLAERARRGLAGCGAGPADRLLVAVSGGVDSVVLLHLLSGLGQPLVAAHVDHRLRPDSAADGAFVAAACARLGVPCRQLAVAVGEGNLQDQARRARYAALADAARQHGCPAVATGHTATDQAETVLLALGRGAGLRGLAGMAPRRPLAEGVDLVRPLLDVARAEIERYARAHGLAWREDASNQGDMFRRNRLRHNVMVDLRKEMGPGLDRRMAAAASHARAGLDVVAAHAAGVGDGRLALARLAPLTGGARRAVLVEAVARWAPGAPRSRALADRLAALVDAPVGARVESGGVRVWREPDALRFGDGAAAEGALTGGALVVTPLPTVPTTFAGGPWTEVVDADRAHGAEVRAWRPGDRVRPLGLGGRQRVADLLRERGVARADRAGVPVVARGDEVLWVVGHRLAASVAVGPETVRAARWSWHAAGGPG